MRSGLTILLTLMLFPALLQALEAASVPYEGEDSLELRVFFKQSDSNLIPSYRENDLRLTRFVQQIRQRMADTTMRLQDVTICTGASPEGRVPFNHQLSIDRGIAIRRYLEIALNVPDSVFIAAPMGEDWERMAEMVKRYRVPSWERILQIIEEHPAPDGYSDAKALEERKRLIQAIDGGAVWRYLLENIFPDLRGGDNYIACHFVQKEAPSQTVTVPQPVSTRDTLYVIRQDTVWMAPSSPASTYLPHTPEASLRSASGGQYPERKKHPADSSKFRKYQFAVKTNLLMDLGTALNVELEFPIGRHWSIMADHWFPWWTFWLGGVSYTMQILQTSVEGRYWFGGGSRKPVLTGFFAGVYAGAAMFDVEWRSEGIQGETFINTGLTFGYSFNIARNWRFELSASAGYFRFDGRMYWHSDYWMLRIWQENRTINWIGPTKLKCSIAWLIPPKGNKKKKGADR